MDRSEVWRKYFRNWPAQLPRKGVLVSSNGDQTPFNNFQTHEDFVLLHRHAPDTVGARDVIVPFSEIVALKMTDVVKPAAYKAAGFQGGAAEKSE